MSRARLSCRASSTAMAIWRIFTASSICISASRPARTSYMCRTDHGAAPRRRARARQDPRAAHLDVRPRHRRARTEHDAFGGRPRAATSPSPRPRKRAKRCSARRSTTATPSSSTNSSRTIWSRSPWTKRTGSACRSPATASMRSNPPRPASTPSSTSGRSATAPSSMSRRHELAEQRLAGNIDQEIVGAYYQTENYDRVIEAMVKHNVAWTPTIAKWLRPLSPAPNASGNGKTTSSTSRRPAFRRRCAR